MMKNEKLCRRYATIAYRLEKAIPDWIDNCEMMWKALSQEKPIDGLLMVQAQAYRTVLKYMQTVGAQYDQENGR